MRTVVTTLGAGRGNVSAAWDGARYAYVFGGTKAGGTLLDDIVRYDRDALSAAAITPELPTPRARTSAFFDGTHAYVLGGRDASGFLADVVRFTPSTGEVATLAWRLPSPRADAAVAWDGARYAYLVGGVGPSGALDEIVRIEPATGSVAATAARLPSPRSGAAAAWTGTVLVVAGGISGAGSRIATIVRHDPSTLAVATMAATLPSPRDGAAAVFDGKNVFVLGGFDGASRLREIVKVDPVADVRVAMSAVLPTGRERLAAVWVEKDVLAFGGRTGPNAYSPHVLSYSLAPGAPRALSATRGPGAGEITLRWTPPPENTVSDFTHYTVFRGNATVPERYVGYVGRAATTFADAGLPAGSPWTYHVRAWDGVRGEGPDSAAASATAPDVPSAPLNLAGARGPGVGEIRLSWDAPADDGGIAVDRYRVYGGDAAGALALLAETASRSFVEGGLAAGATRHYRVRAANAVGEGGATPTVPATAPTAPGSPRNPVASGGPAAGEVHVTWDAPADDGGLAVTAYRVRGGDAADGPKALLGEVPASTRAFTESGLAAGARRAYEVSGINAVGEGAPSAEVVGTAPLPPGYPRDLEAGPGLGLGKIALRWDAPADDGGSPVTAYRVLRSNGNDGWATVARLGNVTTFTDEGRELGVEYAYLVAASNVVGEGEPSNVASALGTKPPAPVPDGPPTDHAVTMTLTPFPTALTAGSSVRVALADARGVPVPATRANVTLALFMTYDLHRWRSADAADNLDLARWTVALRGADVAPDGAAVIPYPGLPGTNGATAILWARYDVAGGGPGAGGYYAVPKAIAASYRAPAQSAAASAATPVFVN